MFDNFVNKNYGHTVPTLDCIKFVEEAKNLKVVGELMFVLDMMPATMRLAPLMMIMVVAVAD